MVMTGRPINMGMVNNEACMIDSKVMVTIKAKCAEALKRRSYVRNARYVSSERSEHEFVEPAKRTGGPQGTPIEARNSNPNRWWFEGDDGGGCRPHKSLENPQQILGEF